MLIKFICISLQTIDNLSLYEQASGDVGDYQLPVTVTERNLKRNQNQNQTFAHIVFIGLHCI